MDPRIDGCKRTVSSTVVTLIFTCFFAVRAFAFSVEVSDAPNSNLNLTLKAIQSAHNSILLNMYEFTSEDIADALAEKIQAGVRVEILQEGSPVGGLSAPAKKIEAEPVREMKRQSGSDHYYEMSKKGGGPRRFRFDHAKYAVIDDDSLLIGSENFSPTGHARTGVLGNRGWEVFIHQNTISKQFTSLFRDDTDLSHGDVIDLTSRRRPEEVWNIWSLLSSLPGFDEDVSASDSLGSPKSLDASSVYSIISPETSESGLVSLLENAESNIDLELMTFDMNWGGATKESPLFNAVVAAAERGVSVRVLLNDENAFTHSGAKDTKNRKTIKLLNSIASKQRVALIARIANLKAMNVTYIHNKGVLVDQDKTLISSINWNENSVERNREAAVVLVSKSIHDHYQNLFEKDWQASGIAP